MSELPLVFHCEGSPLVGVLSRPDRPVRLGVLIVVGGPQYRAGSHRQFVSLARALAAGGFACLRFDYRGMGDSAAPQRRFESVDADLKAAIDALFEAVPELDGVVLWGLCDGASAALMYAPLDVRVEGVVALNPWVRTEASLAAARIDHYYKGKLLSVQFWRRLFGGEVRVGHALAGLAGALKQRLKGKARNAARGSAPARTFIERMGEGWQRLRGRVLVGLSGNDLTAREFADFCHAHPMWREAVEPGPNFFELADADHTFSSRDWKHAIEQRTLDWLRAGLASSATQPCDEPHAAQGSVQFQRSA